MPHVSFASLVVVAAIAVCAPLLVGLFPRIRVPAVVLEIVAGIAVGPHGFGLIRIDTPIQILALIGLAFLLLLAGLEVDVDRLRGRVLRLAGLGFAVSFVLALAAGFGLHAGALVKSPLLVAIMLSATSLGVVIPVLKDTGSAGTQFGQLVIAAASIADVATIVLLSLFFSGESGSAGAKAVLLSGFVALVAATGFAVTGAERSM